MRGDLRPIGIGQVDAAGPARRSRPADERHRALRRPAVDAASRRRDPGRSGRRDRAVVAGERAPARPNGTRQRRPATTRRWPPPRSGLRTSRGVAYAGGDAGALGRPSRRALRRPAAPGGAGTGTGDGASPDPRRRADQRPRRSRRSGDRAPPRRDQGSGHDGDRHRDPRSSRRRDRRSPAVDGARPDHRRHHRGRPSTSATDRPARIFLVGNRPDSSLRARGPRSRAAGARSGDRRLAADACAVRPGARRGGGRDRRDRPARGSKAGARGGDNPGAAAARGGDGPPRSQGRHRRHRV